MQILQRKRNPKFKATKTWENGTLEIYLKN